MEDLKSAITTFRDNRAVRDDNAKQQRSNRQQKLNNIANSLQALDDNTSSEVTSIRGTLDVIKTNLHVIEKIRHETRASKGLPIPHHQQKEVLNLMTNVCNLIKKTQKIKGSSTCQNFAELIEETRNSTGHVKHELKDIKNTVNELERLDYNVKMICEYDSQDSELEESFESTVIFVNDEE